MPTAANRAGVRLMASVTDFLVRRLKLTVNADKSAVDRPAARAFLGSSFTVERTPRRRIAPQALARLKLPHRNRSSGRAAGPSFRVRGPPVHHGPGGGTLPGTAGAPEQCLVTDHRTAPAPP